MLRTKCIFADAEPDDGLRISVMSRHTLDDGVTPDLRITVDSFDYHWTVYAPNPQLIGSYLRDEIDWTEFDQQYRQAQRMPEQVEKLWTLIRWAEERNITLLCKEATPEQCHRRLLAEECQLLDPTLKVHIA